MRVIAGQFRSRRLKGVPGLHVRPTPDRLRESLFSILAPRLEGSIFLDAYAGSGSVGIEALSRGAQKVIFIEKDRAAVEILRENLDSLAISAAATVVRGQAAMLVRNYMPDMCFLDPPYEQTDEYGTVLEALGERERAFVIAQHATRFSLADRFGHLKKVRTLRQGDNTLSFFESGT